VVEIMGHRTGWLALGAGVSGGADVILIPEIPYNIDSVAESILERSRGGKNFSIVAVAEGAISQEGIRKIEKAKKELHSTEDEKEILKLKAKLKELDKQYTGKTAEIARILEKITGLESRLTILGHLQRGGTPSPADRLLATRLGTACVEYIQNEQFGIMVAAKGDGTEAVPLKKVIGIRKIVPIDHPWIRSARYVGTCLGE
ncbi:MAG: 6-phosphofructokinase, partial [Bacteroidales bacterium]|nr:6-phosphofructokinase [Bacteroidales bacterium]